MRNRERRKSTQRFTWFGNVSASTGASCENLHYQTIKGLHDFIMPKKTLTQYIEIPNTLATPHPSTNNLAQAKQTKKIWPHWAQWVEWSPQCLWTRGQCYFQFRIRAHSLTPTQPKI